MLSCPISIAPLTLLLVIGGCSAIDTVNNRAETVNRSNSEYNNTATLLNIIRAGNFEPLSFASVSSFQAHNGVAGSLGLPSASFGPAFALSSFATGSSSATASDSSDYAVNINDDKTFYGPLMVPLDPVTINSFIRAQGYPRELLFFLAIDHISITAGKGRSQYLENNPLAPSFGEFGGRLAELLNAGLTTISIKTLPPKKSNETKGKSSVNSNTEMPPAPVINGTFCFDRSLPPTNFQGHAIPATYSPSCDNISTGGIKNKDKDDGSFTFESANGDHIRVTLRSTFGIYQYLGRFLFDKSGINNLIPPNDNGDTAILTVKNTERQEGCFVSATYRGIFYCVPQTANNTKRVFTLLRQLAALNIPAAPPATTTSVHLTTP